MKDLSTTYLIRTWKKSATVSANIAGGHCEPLMIVESDENVFDLAYDYEDENAKNEDEGKDHWRAEFTDCAYHLCDLENADHSELSALVSKKFLTPMEATEIALETLGYDFEFTTNQPKL